MLLASLRVELLCNLANKDSWQSKQNFSGQVTRHIELPLGHNYVVSEDTGGSSELTPEISKYHLSGLPISYDFNLQWDWPR